jgi:hypothetical protein
MSTIKGKSMRVRRDRLSHRGGAGRTSCCASEQDRTHLRRMIEEEIIMTTDTSGMTVEQQHYYDNLCDEIINR